MMPPHMDQLTAALFAIICSLIISLVSAECPDSKTVTLQDDACQYTEKWNPWAKDYKVRTK